MAVSWVDTVCSVQSFETKNGTVGAPLLHVTIRTWFGSASNYFEIKTQLSPWVELPAAWPCWPST